MRIRARISAVYKIYIVNPSSDLWSYLDKWKKDHVIDLSKKNHCVN